MTQHSDSRLLLSPGRGLGEFRLGDSLYSILSILRYKPIVSTSSITIHSDDEALRSSVILRLNPSTIDMKFDGVTQRLCSITMSLPSISFDVVYDFKVIIPRNTTLSRTEAGVLFGPCRSDTLDQWPGMKWDFRQGQSSSVNISASPTPILDDMIAEVMITPKQSVKFVFTGDPLSQYELKLTQSTTADVVSLLGPPEQTFEKRDKRLGVYATNEEGDEHGVFYNYPTFGVDVLLNSINHKVEKLILHSNIPATPLFQAYNRCMWRMTLPDEGGNGEKVGVSSGDRVNGNGNEKGNGKRSKKVIVNENNKYILHTDKVGC